MRGHLNCCVQHGELIYIALMGRVETVEHADSTICIADEALCTLTTDSEIGFRLINRLDGRDGHTWYPICGYHGTHFCEPLGRDPDFCFYGCQFIVEPMRGDKLVYVIGEYDYCENAWHATWPD